MWAHTFTKNIACVFYKIQFFVMVKNQMQDDACVYVGYRTDKFLLPVRPLAVPVTDNVLVM